MFPALSARLTVRGWHFQIVLTTSFAAMKRGRFGWGSVIGPPQSLKARSLHGVASRRSHKRAQLLRDNGTNQDECFAYLHGWLRAIFGDRSANIGLGIRFDCEPAA